MGIVNVFTRAVAELPQKVSDYVSFLDKTGQVDRDANRDPIILSYGRDGSGYRVKFTRDGYEENFFINHRKRVGPGGHVEPVSKTWDESDGFVRRDAPKQRLVSPEAGGSERRMRSLKS